MINQDDEARDSLLRVTGRRGINASLLAGWLLSIGQKQSAKTVLAILDCQEGIPMLWRAALSEVASERQRFISMAQHCHTLRVRPNTLDEVQMLQKHWMTVLLPVICWGASGISKRRYDRGGCLLA